MENWKEVCLGDICVTNAKTYSLRDSWDYIDYLDTGNITMNKIDSYQRLIVGSDNIPSRAKRKIQPKDILFSTVRPNQRHYGIIKQPVENMVVSTGFTTITAKPEYCDPNFIYYYLTQNEIIEKLQAIAEQTVSTYPSIKASDLESLVILLPPLAKQRKIAEILGALDDKIELNNRINANLEAQATAIFRSWFVDFEPFASGEFIDSPLGKIPKGWKVGTLGDIVELFDSKRIPLSGNERDKMEKIYPYYGAASLMDYVDDYLFDGIYLLLGEDGTVISNDGFPILQYVWGKFWVNNHAHIMIGTNGFTVESLYILLKQTSVNCAVTGAVQPKINQANLKSIQIIIPPLHLLDKYNKFVTILFASIRNNNEEHRLLITLRETLLPKLMNNEINLYD